MMSSRLPASVLMAAALFVASAGAQEPKTTAEFHAFSDWKEGLAGEFILTTTEPAGVVDWTISFDLPANISTIWGGKVESRVLQRYRVRAERWNRRIEPGTIVRLGLQAEPGGAVPQNVMFEPVLAPPPPVPKNYWESGPARMWFQVLSNWGSGSLVEVTVQNQTWSTLRNWSLFLDYPASIDHVQGAGLTASAGTKHRFDAPGSEYNETIPPKASIKFSFIARSSGSPPSKAIFRAADLGPPQRHPNYIEALQKSLYFYEAQRSGKLPPSNRVTWRGDSALGDGGDVRVDLTGGYYDAGDHVKFILPMSSSLTLLAWGGIEYRQGYERAGEFERLQDTIRWGVDWLIKAHASPNELYVQVGEGKLDHAYWGSPEKMASLRRAFKIDTTKPGSDAAGEAAAALAAASLFFRQDDTAYSEVLLKHARELFAFAEQFRGKYSDSVPEAREFYPSSDFQDELAWAATWLYCATREPDYLARAENLYNYKLRATLLAQTHTWDDKRYGTAVLLARVTGKEIYRQDAEAFLDYWSIGKDGKRVPYTQGGLAWLNEWGTLRYAANTAFLAFVYSDTVRDYGNSYYRFARRQIDYMLGENPPSRSYMVGFGTNSPRNPHHRASHGSPDGQIDNPLENQNILFGALVGGPSRPDDAAFVDDRRDLHTNEVALDYNAGFTGALARMVISKGGLALKDFPPKPAPTPTPALPPAIPAKPPSR